MEVGLCRVDWTLCLFDRDPAPPQKLRGQSPPIFGPCLLQPNGCMDQDVTLYGGRPRPRQHCVRREPSSSSPKGAEAPPQFLGPCLLWPHGWMDEDDTWHGGWPSSRPHCAKWGPSSPPPKEGRATEFSAHFYCGQTAGYIMMPLGMEVGLSCGDFVLDRDPGLLPPKGAKPRKFGRRLLWPNGCMDQDIP